MSRTRAVSTTSRRELSSSFSFFLQGKVSKETHAILTKTLARFLPGRAKDLSAPLHNYGLLDCRYRRFVHLPDTTVRRQRVAPKPWHTLTELHVAVCHKAVPYGSLNELLSISRCTAGIHGSISDKLERRDGETVAA